MTPIAAISARGNNWRVTVDGGAWSLGGGISQSHSTGWFTPAGSLVPGRWHDFVVETKLSSSGQGYMKLWLKKEGQLAVLAPDQPAEPEDRLEGARQGGTAEHLHRRRLPLRHR